MRIGIGQAEGVDTSTVIVRVLEQVKRGLNGEFPQAGILFCSAEFDSQIILTNIQNTFPGIQIIGCTSAGDFSSAFQFSEFSISFIAFFSESLEFTVGLGEEVDKYPSKSVQTALSSGRKDRQTSEELCLFLPDINTTGSSEVIDAFTKELSNNCQLFGGCAARHGASSGSTSQFFNDQVVQNALPVLLIGGGVDYSFSVSKSWTPVGKTQHIGSANGRELETLQDGNALDFFYHYLGKNSRPSSEFPLAIYEDHRDDFYLRVPIRYDDEKGSVTFGAYLPQKAKVQLTKAVPNQVLENAEASVENVIEDFPQGSPDAALVFSCNARKGILGTLAKHELELIQKRLPKGTPVIGFYGFAEFSPSKDLTQSRLHHTSMVTLLIGEKEKSNPTEANNNQIDKKRKAKEKIPSRTLKHQVELLEKKLLYSEYQRDDLEKIQQTNVSLLQAINEEIEEARREIQTKNEELEKIYKALQQEKDKSERLLLNILPEPIADELKAKGQVEPVFHEKASVLFTDFQGFTTVSSQMKPKELVVELDYFFTEFDLIIETFGLEKLKTIGDAYMCVGGILQNPDDHVLNMVHAAWQMNEMIQKTREDRLSRGDSCWNIRIGIHTGPIMAGVIGKKKFAYDIWGDTVNIASRLESTSQPGKINVSKEVYEIIKADYECSYRGRIKIKNRGEIDMYFVDYPK